MQNSKSHINLVIFDLFGTLIKFDEMHNPFRMLMKWARENGRQPLPNDARTIMTINGGVAAICLALNIKPPSELVQTIEAKIEDELSSISLFSDVVQTLNFLQSRRVRIGVCSNLAQPYGIAIDKLLADFDLERFLSYELGTIKPEYQMYESILGFFSCKPSQCLFVGDTFDADYAGPAAMGMNALHLNRNGLRKAHEINSLVDVLAYLD